MEFILKLLQNSFKYLSEFAFELKNVFLNTYKEDLPILKRYFNFFESFIPSQSFLIGFSSLMPFIFVIFTVLYCCAHFFGSEKRLYDSKIVNKCNSTTNPKILTSTVWLKSAHLDLNSAKNDLEGPYFSHTWVYFKCYKVLEKSIIALLYFRNFNQSATKSLKELSITTKDQFIIKNLSLVYNDINNSYNNIITVKSNNLEINLGENEAKSFQKALSIHKITETIFQHIKSKIKH